MFDFDPKLLLVGGLASIPLVFHTVRQHLSSAVSVIRSILVKEVCFTSVTGAEMAHSYLQSRCRVLPTCRLLVENQSVFLTSRRTWTQTFFRFQSPAYAMVAFYGFAPILWTNSRFYYIQGTLDVANLLREATLHRVDLSEQGTRESTSRFEVCRVFGSEKGSISFGMSKREKKQEDEGLTASYVESTRSYPFDWIGFANDEVTFDIASNHKPFSTVFFNPEVVSKVNDARSWLANKDWYFERSIPWRRGWLLHGPGGTGKSTLAMETAKELALPIYVYHLATLSDQEFISSWTSMRTPCIALFEDMDTVFHGRDNVTEHKSLTFECLLNSISGVGAVNGVFLIVTTNHIEHIDPALGTASEDGQGSSRPGRLDSIIYLGACSPDIRLKIATHVLKDWADAVTEVLSQAPDTATSAQIMEECVKFALHRLQKEQS